MLQDPGLSTGTFASVVSKGSVYCFEVQQLYGGGVLVPLGRMLGGSGGNGSGMGVFREEGLKRLFAERRRLLCVWGWRFDGSFAARDSVDIPPFEGSCWTGLKQASFLFLGVESA